VGSRGIEALGVWLGVVVIALFAALGIGAAPASARTAEPFSGGCPKEVLEEGLAGQVDHNPRARHALAPSGAVSVRICRYYGFGEAGKQTPKTQARVGQLRDQVELRGSGLLESLGLEFAELEPVGKGSYNCPSDEGARLFAVFSYAGAKPVIVEVNLSGCRFAYNGHVSGFMTESLQAKLERLLESHRRPAPIRGEVHKKVVVAYPPPHLSFAVAKHRLLEYAEESGCEGRCTSFELRHCRRKSKAIVTCRFVGRLPGEVCRAGVSVQDLEGPVYALSASVDDKQCPAELFTPPEVREHLEEIERERAERSSDAAPRDGARAGAASG
jgi:hypothetical protein